MYVINSRGHEYANQKCIKETENSFKQIVFTSSFVPQSRPGVGPAKVSIERDINLHPNFMFEEVVQT